MRLIGCSYYRKAMKSVIGCSYYRKDKETYRLFILQEGH